MSGYPRWIRQDILSEAADTRAYLNLYRSLQADALSVASESSVGEECSPGVPAAAARPLRDRGQHDQGNGTTTAEDDSRVAAFVPRRRVV